MFHLYLSKTQTESFLNCFRVFRSIFALVGLISYTSASSDSNMMSPGDSDREFSNETKIAAEKYFKNLLRKVTDGESVEDSTFKIIQTETELRAAYCSLFNKNNETDGYLDKKDKRLISEMRKLNMKLMKIEDKLSEIESSMVFLISSELKAIKNELLRNMRNMSGQISKSDGFY